MLLRNPISNTKRFFQRTLRSFKSLFTGTETEPYHKLPKTSPYNPYSFAGVDMNQETSPRDKWDTNNGNRNTRILFTLREGNKGKTREGSGSSSSERRRNETSSLMARRLKELEMMDMSDVDQVLDIQEILHYYSRLTCPTYLDIVDKFFMEMYAENFEALGSSSVESRTKYRSR
ncbi:hypothetical protein F3Y22_tig00111234pilonHSYRG00039 [Hibiscus syriacus]|uniref:OVATE domain-containing protein n=1 Tax=Hibiscus syriacus TaxID=106335 RepID=A0A6A2YTK9_HIBSY|nr:uncharacterized protein LOC120156635 [Hibiscus syriacus]KAE8682831.1 hypothetical protein F3Y22_tig00111234pilonHSYRG00039 [Hibiscus syriacus]